jgi:hypothetical protein
MCGKKKKKKKKKGRQKEKGLPLGGTVWSKSGTALVPKPSRAGDCSYRSFDLTVLVSQAHFLSFPRYTL